MRSLRRTTAAVTLALAFSVTTGFVSGCGSTDSAAPEAPRGTLSGRVVIRGAAELPPLSVTLTGPVTRQAFVTTDGAFSFDKLPDATYVLAVDGPSTRERSLTKAVTVSGGAAATTGDLELTGLGKIEGVVIGVDGKPAAGALVLPLSASTFAITGATGSYSVEAPVAPTTVRAVLGGAGGVTSASVDVKYAATSKAPDIQLSQATGDGGATLGGTASLVGDADASGIVVSVEGTALSATTAKDGAYTIAGVPTGVHAVRFKKGAFEEVIPGVLSLPGSPPLVLDDGLLAPLSAVEIQRGKRAVSAPELSDASLTGVAQAASGGAGVFAVQHPAGNPSYYVHNASTSRALGRLATPPVVSANGARVVYLTDAGDLRSGPIAGADALVERSVAASSVLLSPTSNALTYGVGGGNRKLAALDGSGKVDLGPYFPVADFSADGAKLLFGSAASLAKVAAVPGGAQTDLVAAGALAQPLFTSNGAVLVSFSATSGALQSVAVPSAVVTPIVGTASILYRAADRSVLAAYGLGKVVVMNGADGSLVGSADGAPLDAANGVVLYTGAGGLHAFVAATGKDLLVGSAARVGNAVVFYLSGSELRRVAFDGTGDALVEANVTQFDLSADRSRLLVVKADGNADTRPVAAGAAPVALGKITGVASLSPDGKAVAVIDPPTVRIATAATGALQLAMTRATASFAWDGATLLAVRAGEATPLRAQNGLYRLTP
ncbi:MAG: hypothetical protein JNL38_35210 [Myxococcales bacterium]|nr:hypothetical protein [Myxococcales bacterium]